MKMQPIYAAITKVDPDQRLVEGYASTEALDAHGEIVSRDAIMAALDDYMAFANIREMHQPIAIGKTKSAVMDDKGLYISVKVVDDAAWKKVKEEVLMGFSIGGEVVEKVGNTITKLNLQEISLVDRPACPEAVFSVWKATGARPPMKIEKSQVLAAVDQVGATLFRKSLCSVADLSMLLSSLAWITQDTTWEAEFENDQSQVPAMLRAGFDQLSAALTAMTAEETAEASADLKSQAGVSDTSVVDSSEAGNADAGAGEADGSAAKVDGDAAKTDEEKAADAKKAVAVKSLAKGDFTPEQIEALKTLQGMLVDAGIVDANGNPTGDEAKGDDAGKDDEKSGDENKDGDKTDEEKAADAKKAADADAEAGKDDEEGDDKQTVTKFAKGLGLEGSAGILDLLEKSASHIESLEEELAQAKAEIVRKRAPAYVVDFEGKSEPFAKSVVTEVEKKADPKAALAALVKGSLSGSLRK